MLHHCWHSPHQKRVPLLMDVDGVHLRVHGAFLILHCQVILPQAHTVGQVCARSRKERCQMASGRANRELRTLETWSSSDSRALPEGGSLFPSTLYKTGEEPQLRARDLVRWGLSLAALDWKTRRGQAARCQLWLPRGCRHLTDTCLALSSLVQAPPALRCQASDRHHTC